LYFYNQIPNIGKVGKEDYYSYIKNIIELTERYNFYGTLIYYNHETLDPWQVISIILNNSKTLKPLIAVQPYVMPPFYLAKVIQTISYIYNRQVCLNFITGNNSRELDAIREPLDHDQRYERLEDFINSFLSVLNSKESSTYQGKYYSHKDLRLKPTMDKNVFPKIYLSGMSDSNINLANRVAEVALTKAEPIDDFYKNYFGKFKNKNIELGIRIGIIARKDSSQAFEIANERFQPSRKSIITSNILSKRSDNETIRRLNTMALKEKDNVNNTFYTGGILAGKTNNSYLVGSYTEVAKYILQYKERCNVKHILVQIEKEEDFVYINEVRKQIKLLESSPVGI
jgi:alkanesulfonate monooxygenase